MPLRIICNPLDLPYRHQEVTAHDGIRTVFREAADPTVLRVGEDFLLFASVSRGWWRSRDLVTWELVDSASLPADDYAPDIALVDGDLVFSASRRANGRVYRAAGAGEEALRDEAFSRVADYDFPIWDPAIFQDDDGRVYLYWGCSATEPVRGVELDPRTLQPLGEPIALIRADGEAHGWERNGEDHGRGGPLNELDAMMAQYTGNPPFIEGAFMTKHEGRYHLQYAAPGTQYNTYADGAYVAESPLGPYTYETTSPFSFKPGGFATGAGHGSTFQDRHGNWWHAATLRVSVNGLFERRVGLFPAGFDEDGKLFCHQEFGDYPFAVPDGPADPRTLGTGWMLQSYRCAATASSSLDGHGPEQAVNEEIRTWWAAAGRGAGEWLALDLGELSTVHALQVNLADHDTAAMADGFPGAAEFAFGVRAVDDRTHATELLVEVSEDGASWATVHDSRGGDADTPHALIVLPAPLEVRHVRVSFGLLPFGGRPAVSGLRVFGLGHGEPPAAVTPSARRRGPLDAHVSWPAADGADGYLVRYGAAPDRLHHAWQVHGRTELDVSSLNAGVEYFFAVDAFNRHGVASGPTVGEEGA